MFLDLPLEQLQAYRPPRDEPEDFDDFWALTLQEARKHPLDPRFIPVDSGLAVLESFDVEFRGFGGQAIKGWLILPKARSGKLPCVVEYLGYGGGRAFPASWLLWASAGYAHLVMDTRGQGSLWSPGDTSDVEPDGGSPQVPGFLTRGILDPHTYYYRRLFTDAVRAVECARAHPEIDRACIIVSGTSQGGGVALAVAGLVPEVAAVLPDLPFLCHIRAAVQITDTMPYQEIAQFCRVHRDKVDQTFSTLAYFDGLNFAVRAAAPALFSVGLMDEVCPPRTVFAAYNLYAGEKEMRIWEFNHHEGGQIFQDLERLAFVRSRCAPTSSPGVGTGI
jgi:cephalosporin-C deacetylase